MQKLSSLSDSSIILPFFILLFLPSVIVAIAAKAEVLYSCRTKTEFFFLRALVAHCSSSACFAPSDLSLLLSLSFDSSLFMVTLRSSSCTSSASGSVKFLGVGSLPSSLCSFNASFLRTAAAANFCSSSLADFLAFFSLDYFYLSSASIIYL